jgi:hypothetical protein
VFLGFGVLFANTAVVNRPRSCASCSGPPVDREVYLSQYDITYALALFCELKDVPDRQSLSHLRRSLRGHFKRCRRDVRRRSKALADLRAKMDESRASGRGKEAHAVSIADETQRRV